MGKLQRFFIHPDYVRSTIFGIEDALVSTTGVVVGVAAGVDQKHIVILAGLVTVAVEALSMGTGQYLSEEAVHQMKKSKHADSLWIGALCMFFGYLLAGFIPIFPLFFLPLPLATVVSITSALMGLYVLGFVKGKIVHGQATQSALKILFVGGLTVLIGIAVGRYFKVPGS